MMQSLLAERFKLTVHRDSKEFSGYALVVDKGGPKFPQSTGEDEKRARAALPDIPKQPMIMNEFAPGGVWRLRGIEASMDFLAGSLEARLGLPVLNQTGITGVHNFVVEGNREDLPQTAPAMPGTAASGVSIFTSVHDIGLALKAQKVSLPVIVVDHAEKVPTGN